MSDLVDLIARVEKARGPDRDLDAAILSALPYLPLMNNPRPDSRWTGHVVFEHASGDTDSRTAPAYTASIDAALALVERVLPGVWYVLAKGRLTAVEALFGCELLFSHDTQLGIAAGQTQALAIVAATLLALRSKQAEAESDANLGLGT